MQAVCGMSAGLGHRLHVPCRSSPRPMGSIMGPDDKALQASQSEGCIFDTLYSFPDLTRNVHLDGLSLIMVHFAVNRVVVEEVDHFM